MKQESAGRKRGVKQRKKRKSGGGDRERRRHFCQLVMGVLYGIPALFAMTQIADRAFTLHSLAYLMLLFQARCARCVTWKIAFKSLCVRLRL